MKKGFYFMRENVMAKFKNFKVSVAQVSPCSKPEMLEKIDKWLQRQQKMEQS